MSDKLNQEAEELIKLVQNEVCTEEGWKAHGRIRIFKDYYNGIAFGFKAGHASRDAEVAEKDAEIMRLKEKLWAAEGRIKGMTEGLEILKGEK